MKINICVSYSDKDLESHRPNDKDICWELIASGFWDEDTYHSGHISYYLTKVNSGYWIVNAVERNAMIDDVTEEDLEEGRLNDDQLQAIWYTSLEEAQSKVYESIVAVCTDSPPKIESKEMAQILYNQICKSDGKIITEPDNCDCLLII